MLVMFFSPLGLLVCGRAELSGITGLSWMRNQTEQPQVATDNTPSKISANAYLPPFLKKSTTFSYTTLLLYWIRLLLTMEKKYLCEKKYLKTKPPHLTRRGLYA
jgi:hypothetical protein